MDLKKDIERAVRHIAADNYKNPKTDIELQELANRAIESYESRTYSFSDYSSMLLNQGLLDLHLSNILACYTSLNLYFKNEFVKLHINGF